MFRFLCILFILLTLLPGRSSLAGAFKVQKKVAVTVNKTAAGSLQSLVNIGNFAYWLWNDGVSAHSPYTGGAGGFYPRGTSNVLYQDGLIWAGYVRDPDPSKPQLRAGGNSYTNGTISGWWGGDPDDERARVYRIRQDWRSLTYDDVAQDAAELFNVSPPSAVSDQMIDAVIAQYKEDWKNWPTDLGAPYYDVNDNGIYDPVLDEAGLPVIARYDEEGHIIEGGDYPGIANADMVLWYVINDGNENRTRAFAGSPPIGLEIQITVWAYRHTKAAIGQSVFKKYKITNHSGYVIDSLYLGQWSDPDIGDYDNDLIGCDSVNQYMFAYNADMEDASFKEFGLPPPAVGYQLLQGPLVPSPGDTAVFDLKKLPDYKNLPMTSFGAYNRAFYPEPPVFGEYVLTRRWYNVLRGFLPYDDLDNPQPFTVETGPHTGKPTKFPLSGDPVTQNNRTADLDGYVHPAGDRRMMMCSGPIKMEPGAVQEMLVAVSGGLADDNIQSIADMRGCAQVAAIAYKTLFKNPPLPPARPNVKATPLDNKIVLDWGWDVSAVSETEKNSGYGYEFEGYNIYQLPKESSKLSDPGVVRVATFDKINGVRIIKSLNFDPQYGMVVELPVQYGTDAGLQRYFFVDKDYIHNLPLYRGSTYYFAISGYNYNRNFLRDRALESIPVVVEVTVQNPLPGYRYEGEPGEEIDVVHHGSSDGQAQVIVVDPSATTGHDYEIFFYTESDTNASGYGQTFWGLLDKTTGDTVARRREQLPDLDTDDALTFNGLLVKVAGPALTMKSFELVANGNGPLDPAGSAGALWEGFPVPDPNYNVYPNMANGSFWMIHTWPNGSRASFSAFMERTFEYTGGYGNPDGTGIQHLIPRDFEIRFTGNGKAFDSWNTETVIDVPFELWDIGNADDPDDDFQLVPYLYDYDRNGVFNLMYDASDPAAPPGWADHEVSIYPNDPWTDPFYWIHPVNNTPGSEGYNQMIEALQNDPSGAAPWYARAGDASGVYDGWAGMHRMVLVSWNAGDVTKAASPSDYNAALPDAGAVFRLVTTKPNTPNDTFVFTSPTVRHSMDQARADVEQINVFPNPYYASNPQEKNYMERFVTFNHLPRKAVFRIFNLAGALVRKLEKDDESQFFRWNLQNGNGRLVASGVYIVHIDMPELGKQKVLKVFIVQGQQMIEYF